MLRNLSISGLVLLVGCVSQPTIQGTNDSLANRLRVGMTESDVMRVVGAEQFATNPDYELGGVNCLSIVYDEVLDAKFIHAFFRNGVLEAASDGHEAVCEA